MKTIARIKYGSHLYGTNTPTSDLDYKSVHIPSAEDILLQTVKSEIVLNAPDKAEGTKNRPGDVDDKSYSLQAFLNLAAEGQTVAIDMLFSPQQSVVQSCGWWWYIVENRQKLLSKKSAAFLGYCRQQANKYGIKGSRVAAAKMASEIFSEALANYGPMAKVGELTSSVPRLLEANPEHCSVVEQAVGSPGAVGKFFECCGRKVAFSSSVKQAAEIYTRIYENYGARAKLAQDNEGVDWKALSHAVRVGEEAVELLTTGHVTLPLVNAEHIRDIKLGKLPYQHVSEEIERLLEAVEEAAKTSPLPDEPDHDFIRDTVVNAYGSRVHAEHCKKHYLDESK
jgi:hypothetical protein